MIKPNTRILIDLLEEWEATHSFIVDSSIAEQAYNIAMWYNCTPMSQEVLDLIAELEAIKFVYPHIEKHLVLHIK